MFAAYVLFHYKVFEIMRLCHNFVWFRWFVNRLLGKVDSLLFAILNNFTIPLFCFFETPTTRIFFDKIS